MKARTRISRGYISPCPHCGSPAFDSHAESKDFKGEFGWYITCSNDLCGCRTPLMADLKNAMRIWNQRKEYSLLNYKLRKLYESLFARVGQYARTMREVYSRNPEAVGAVIDDLSDFADYFADPQCMQLRMGSRKTYQREAFGLTCSPNSRA